MLAGVASAVGRGSPNNEWSTRLAQHDAQVPTNDWLMACFCLPCASASAKSKVDKSDCFTNFCCWTPVATTSYVRLSYGINGVCGDDLGYGLFCPCCTVRRTLTETNQRGFASNAVPPEAGGNLKNWQVSLFDCGLLDFCEALVCAPCVAHNVRQMMQPTADSCCFDCLCVAPPAMYGLVRHRNGIISDCALAEDVCVPLICMPCALNRARKEQALHMTPLGAAQAAFHQVAQVAQIGGYRRV